MKIQIEDVIKVKEDRYKCRKKNYWAYGKITNCNECGALLFIEGGGNAKLTTNNFCDRNCQYNFYHINGNIGDIKNTNTGYKKWNDKWWEEYISYNCKQCGVECFVRKSSKNINNFCGIKCKSKYYRKDKLGGNILDNDTSNFYYILGLFTTDGCNTGDGVSISLQNKDKELLIKSSKLFGGTISETKRYNCTNWNIYNREFSEYLTSIGITMRKSSTLNINEWFSTLGGEHKRHFIRGCWDGDGTVCKTKKGWNVRITSQSTQFSDTIVTYFSNLGFENMKRKCYNSHNYMCFNDKFAIAPMRYIYTVTSDDLVLSRKYDKVQDLISELT